MPKPAQEMPTSGYALVVDGQVKIEFKTEEGAKQGARDLKRRFPTLQIRLYNAAAKRSEDIAFADA
jgi:hypothetical protein